MLNVYVSYTRVFHINPHGSLTIFSYIFVLEQFSSNPKLLNSLEVVN